MFHMQNLVVQNEYMRSEDVYEIGNFIAGKKMLNIQA